MLPFLAAVVVAAFLAAVLQRYWNAHDNWFASATMWLTTLPLVILVIGIVVLLSAAVVYLLLALQGRI